MPTEKELEQMRAAAVDKALKGEDPADLLAVYNLATGAVPGLEPDKT